MNNEQAKVAGPQARKQREAEIIRAGDADTAVKYAIEVVDGRWYAAEQVIQTDAAAWKQYLAAFNLPDNPPVAAIHQQQPQNQPVEPQDSGQAGPSDDRGSDPDDDRGQAGAV